MSVPSHLKKKLLVIRGLGIAQIVIGIVTVVLGIVEVAAFDTGNWAGNSGAGIWGGIWILITGILGTLLRSFKKNNCLNGTHLSFCIVAMVITWIEGIIFIAFLRFTNDCIEWSEYYQYYNYGYYTPFCGFNPSAARGITGTLLFLAIAEFAIALTACILSCQTNTACCGGTSTTGVIIAQQQPMPATIITTQPNNILITQAPTHQPQVIYPQFAPQPVYYQMNTTDVSAVNPLKEQTNEAPPTYSY